MTASAIDTPVQAKFVRPYKGLVPYAEEDRPWFFGRDGEREIIAANVFASRLTVLYGASGVGKSSLLRAGVANDLREAAVTEPHSAADPEYRVVVFDSWRDDPTRALYSTIRDASEPAGGGPRGLAEAVTAINLESRGKLILILDQFEEYFLYRGPSTPGDFEHQLARVVNDPGLRANVLLSLRDDALADLDRFKGLIPTLFDNCLRVEHLSHDAAREAIQRPLAHYNANLGPNEEPVTVEPEMVERVLSQVTAELHRGLAGVGSSPTPFGERVEAPYLQLVMNRLWNEERRAGSSKLRLSTLEQLGGAQQIVRTHLDDALASLSRRQQDVAAQAFRYLVTPSGTKIAHLVADLAEYGSLSVDELTAVLDRLSASDTRILRPVPSPADHPNSPRFEIFHDVLATPVLDWRLRHLRALERRRATRVRRLLIAASVGLVLVVSSATVIVSQKNADLKRARQAPFSSAEFVFINGFGPFILGTTPQQINDNLRLHGRRTISFPDPIVECRPFTFDEAPEGVTFTIADGFVQRMTFDSRARAMTLRGAGIGTKADGQRGSLQSIYGPKLTAEDGRFVYRATDAQYRPYQLVFRVTPEGTGRVVGFWNEMVGGPCPSQR